jgi:chaperonin GroES
VGRQVKRTFKIRSTSEKSSVSIETFQPIYNRVLLKRIDGGSTTKSGMIVPDTAKEKPTECEVVAINKSYINEFNTLMICPVSVGDRVLIGKYSGSNEIKLNGVEHVSVKWDELIGVKSDDHIVAYIPDSVFKTVEEYQRIAEEKTGARPSNV